MQSDSLTFSYIPGNLTGKVAIAVLPALDLFPLTDSSRESVGCGSFHRQHRRQSHRHRCDSQTVSNDTANYRA